jgi:non-homologous end joining protein Ku
MPRVIWKRAISFGLVHVPVALYPASSESGIDIDWLDQRTIDPVGYKRINKRTGQEVESTNIVRGCSRGRPPPRRGRSGASRGRPPDPLGRRR